MPSSFVDSRINQNLEVATEYFRALVSKRTYDTENKLNTSAGSLGFIPFNMNFTMDGISGIKIYNKLSVDTSFLPPGYTNTMEFIVTGVNHKVQNGDWETNITTTFIPKTGKIDNYITSSLTIFGQVEQAPAAPTSTSGTGGKGRPPGYTGENAKIPTEKLTLIVPASKAVFGKDLYLYQDAANAYFKFRDAARAAGYDLDRQVTSAYRDYAEQEGLYNNFLSGKATYITGKPGESNHGWGYAIDVNSKYSNAFNTWLRTHCVTYGFYWFGPKDKVHFTYGHNESGYPQEPQQP